MASRLLEGGSAITAHARKDCWQLSQDGQLERGGIGTSERDLAPSARNHDAPTANQAAMTNVAVFDVDPGPISGVHGTPTQAILRSDEGRAESSG